MDTSQICLMFSLVPANDVRAHNGEILLLDLLSLDDRIQILVRFN